MAFTFIKTVIVQIGKQLVSKTEQHSFDNHVLKGWFPLRIKQRWQRLA